MKKILLAATILCAAIVSNAQGAYEAFRFSQTDYWGTARYLGAGGAFSSIGGDFSAINTNPAAIGLYKRNEVSITPIAVSFSKNSASYNGTNSYTQNPKYTVPQCGLVIASPIKNSSWKSWQFGFGYNRIMDYNNTFRVQGENSTSFIDPILSSAMGTHYNNLTGDALLAWNTWLLDTLTGTTDQYFSPYNGEQVEQTAVVRQRGSIDEISFSLGGNYNDKFYIGATIGIPILDYTEQTTYNETPVDAESYEGISSYKVTTYQKNKGTGINARIGIIYQPVNFLRLSAAIHTPTYYTKISDSYTRSMSSSWVGTSETQQSEYNNAYQFTLTTPFKFNVGAGFIIKKRAFISAEYEYYDYSMATLYANDYSFDLENADIDDLYKTCHTLRVGGEVNLTPMFMLRAGYVYKSSPYRLTAENEDIATANGSAHYGSLGFGFHTKYFYFDLAYVLRYSRDNYTLYDSYSDNTGSAYSTLADIKNTTHRIVATIGCKF